MITTVFRALLTGLFLLATGVLSPGMATAATALKDTAACMEIAVDEHGANPSIAESACGATELTTCYRTLRDVYGRQPWALRACQARTH